jgi:hypothetical protein
VAILPYVDSETVYDQYNFAVWPQDVANLTVELARPDLFVCPSDPATFPLVSGGHDARFPAPDPPGGWLVALMSYGLFYGTLLRAWEARPDPQYDPYGQIDGCCNDLQRIPLASITDGTSNTTFASERALSYINQDLIGPEGR